MVKLERVPTHVEFYFRCRVHSVTLDGAVGFNKVSKAGSIFELDMSNLSCPKETISEPCETVEDAWEMFYREAR